MNAMFNLSFKLVAKEMLHAGMLFTFSVDFIL